MTPVVRVIEGITCVEADSGMAVPRELGGESWLEAYS